MPSNEFIEMPLNIEKFRIDDNLLAKAYEEANIDEKAAIKSAIALHYEVQNQHLPIRTMRNKGAFVLHEEVQAATLSVFIVEDNFKSPAQLIAGIMPAILAKSQSVVIFRNAVSENFLLSLELMGIEDIFTIEDTKTIENFLYEMYIKYTSILAINLGFSHALASFVWKNAIPFYFYEKSPVIVGTSPLFAKAYPNVKIYSTKEEIEENIKIDIALNTAINQDEIDYPMLIMGEGLEFYAEALFCIENFLVKDRMYLFSE